MNADDRELFRNTNKFLTADKLQKLKAESHISFDLHRLIKRKELDEYLTERTKIYLDLNFWIKLRESIYKGQNSTSHQHLFEVLKVKVQSGRVICPFSCVLIEEIFKISDKTRRLQTIQIADILSEKILISPLYYIAMCEVSNLNSVSQGNNKSQFWYTWGRPINALGDFNLKTDREIDDHQIVLTKAVYDITMQSSFQQILREGTAEGFINPTSSRWHADMLNRSKRIVDIKNISKRDLHVQEIKSTYRSILKYIEPAVNLDVEAVTKQYTMDEMRAITPFCYAWSSFYVELIFDQERKIKPNDYYDIMHSCAALSTCNFFLTERSFASTMKRMKIDQKFNVTVLSDMDEIIETISSL